METSKLEISQLLRTLTTASRHWQIVCSKSPVRSKAQMKDQVLDSMDLERERGITIKMQTGSHEVQGSHHQPHRYPGHIDFLRSFALKAVEGTVLLVDATQGVQAQTLSTLGMARDQGLTIIPVISK